MKLFEKKYKGIEYNHLHSLKSLTYFEEVEREPMPIMIEKINWENVKKEIKKGDIMKITLIDAFGRGTW